MRVTRSVLLTILVFSVVIGACYAQCPSGKCKCGVAGSNPCAFDYRCCPAYQSSCPYPTQNQGGPVTQTFSGYTYSGAATQSQTGAGPKTQTGTMTTTQPGAYGQGSMMNYQYGTTMQGQYGSTTQSQYGAMSPDMSMQSEGAAFGAGPGGMMAAGMMSSIAVDDTSIYVLRGSEIVKINKNNMQVASTTTLPPFGGAQQTASAAGAGPVTPTVPTAPAATSVPTSSALIVRQSVQNQIDTMRQMQPADFEKTYLEAVINSHAGAIAWSQLVASRATHPELRQFAQNVISDESRVNQQFGIWLNNFYGTSATPTMMQSDTTVLNNLQNLSGSNFEIAYLRAMINHFSEAIVLSRDASQKAVHADIKSAATSLAALHTTQIQQLRNWLSTWYNVSY